MKSALRFVCFLVFLFGLFFSPSLIAQTEDYHKPSNAKDTLYYVQKFDGTGFVGAIIKDDGSEIVIQTENLGRVTVTKNMIDKIERIDHKNVRISNGKLITDDFAARYFYTNSSHSLKEEQGITLWNFWGVEMQYGVTDNFDVGIGTSWVGIPIGLNAKYSFEIAPNITAALGTRVYTGSWASLNSGAIYPFGSITLGKKHTHLSAHGGFLAAYGPRSNGDRAWVFGMAGKTVITSKVDAVVEVFTLPVINTFDPVYFVFPALRLNNNYGKAFQIGFAGAVSGNEALPLPFPFFQIMRTF